MIKALLIIFTALLTSFSFFPFEFFFLPGANTKMVMAGVGLVLLIVQLGKRRDSSADRDFLTLLLYSGLVSLIGFIATVYNGSRDYVYATYIVSMLVWLSSSYVVVSTIRLVHGKATVELLIHYLVAVCVGQCLLAVGMDQYLPLKHLVDDLMLGEEYLDIARGRLYGLGCALDVAGTRFAAVLILLACLCVNKIREKSGPTLALYLASFIVISVVGNMIARTTVIGVITALCYWLYAGGFFTLYIKREESKIWRYILVALVVSLPVFVFLYHTNAGIHANLRFAFEGFFSLYEKGVWETTSNERLAGMVVFPDTLKTWIIGDGYFGNPLDTNPYYIGPGVGDFYMNTDIGYLRFIYYFGLIGTVAFCLYMLRVALICMQRFEGYKVMFLFLLLSNYVIWSKVSTDIFLVFALFLMVSREEYESELPPLASTESPSAAWSEAQTKE